MAAPKGNRFWEVRSKHGRDKTFSDPASLWESACEYFEWVEDNPLEGAKLFKLKDKEGNDEISEESYSKMRAMTIDGLCLFLGIGVSTWSDYKLKDGYKDFSEVISDVENVIRSQKFSGAAADLLNANIIARDLGLKDSTSNEHSGPNGRPIQTQSAVIATEMDPATAAEIYAELMK